MVKIGKTQLLMADGTIRTFSSEMARDRFEAYVEKYIKKNKTYQTCKNKKNQSEIMTHTILEVTKPGYWKVNVFSKDYRLLKTRYFKEKIKAYRYLHKINKYD